MLHVLYLLINNYWNMLMFLNHVHDVSGKTLHNSNMTNHAPRALLTTGLFI